ncbi:hypothetical protein AURDEDRAFT_177472 [Auricularia subglabra TFB-10046 SS5]|uniref:Uncharacterized protein n=1 Tax=Auricularia subglabra (strain TFB-10046 / SS5) TaxID=717982 RepID=J0D439_AURST|nr:hypothetical protein AURDEDRAFT_177472 [Auricularia subglabra TFB-10046 SS5]
MAPPKKLLLSLATMNDAAAHFGYAVDDVDDAEPAEMYSCCVLDDSRNISRPTKLPIPKMHRPELLSQPCGIALAGVAPLLAMFMRANADAPVDRVLEFLQRMWLASLFCEGFAALHEVPRRALAQAGKHWCARFVEIANQHFPKPLPASYPHLNVVHSLVARFLDFGGSDVPALLSVWGAYSESVFDGFDAAFFSFQPAVIPCSRCRKSTTPRACLRVSNKGKCLLCLNSNVSGNCVPSTQIFLEAGDSKLSDDDADDGAEEEEVDEPTTPPPKKRKTGSNFVKSEPTKPSRKSNVRVNSRAPRKPVTSQPPSSPVKLEMPFSSKTAKKSRPSAPVDDDVVMENVEDVVMENVEDVVMENVEDAAFAVPSVPQPAMPSSFGAHAFPPSVAVPLPRAREDANTLATYRRLSGLDPVEFMATWMVSGVAMINALVDVRRDFVNMFGSTTFQRRSLHHVSADFTAFQTWMAEHEAASDGETVEAEEVRETGSARSASAPPDSRSSRAGPGSSCAAAD